MKIDTTIEFALKNGPRTYIDHHIQIIYKTQPKRVYIVLNLVGIQGHGGLMVKYTIHFQNEVKQCTRSLVQSLVKADVFLNFYFTWKYYFKFH